MSYRILDPKKLKERRGTLSMDSVAEKANNSFSKSTYNGWEKGLWKPRPEQIPVLLNALGVTWEEISSPIQELALS